MQAIARDAHARAVRISFAHYTTTADVDRCFEVVDAADRAGTPERRGLRAPAPRSPRGGRPDVVGDGTSRSGGTHLFARRLLATLPVLALGAMAGVALLPRSANAASRRANFSRRRDRSTRPEFRRSLPGLSGCPDVAGRGRCAPAASRRCCSLPKALGRRVIALGHRRRRLARDARWML